MPDFSEFEDKAKQLASEHPDQVDEGLKHAGEFADQRTGGQFGDEIQQGEQRAEGYIGTSGSSQSSQGGQDQYGQGQGGGQGGQDQYGQGGQDQYGQGQGGGQGGQDQYGQDQNQGGSY